MSSTEQHPLAREMVKPRRNSRRVEPSASLTSSAEDRPHPSCRPVSEGEDDSARRGAGDEIHRRRPVRVAVVRAQKPHSSLVAAGSWSTRNFSRYRSECLPLLSRKWPCFSAPERRNSSSVRAAMTFAAASWAGRSNRGHASLLRPRPVALLAAHGRYSAPWRRVPPVRFGRAVPTSGAQDERPAPQALRAQLVAEADRQLRVGEDAVPTWTATAPQAMNPARPRERSRLRSRRSGSRRPAPPRTPIRSATGLMAGPLSPP